MGDQYYFSIIYHINYYVWCTDKITYMTSVLCTLACMHFSLPDNSVTEVYNKIALTNINIRSQK